MGSGELLQQIKRRLSAILLGLDGVVGVGLSEVGVRVYLERDDSALRRNVAAVLAQNAPLVPYEMQASGKIVARSAGGR